MPVIIHSNLARIPFWQDVKHHLVVELEFRELEQWTVFLCQRIPGDDSVSISPMGFRLSIEPVEEIVGRGQNMNAEVGMHCATITFSDIEEYHFPEKRVAAMASELAVRLADNLESLIEAY